MARQKLKKDIHCYTKDTFEYIYSVETFCERFTEWEGARNEEINKMKDIKERYEKHCQTLGSIFSSAKKGKDLREYMKRKMTLKFADSRRAELQRELDALLQDTLIGLEELHRFLEAVEKLAVTSLHVFQEENQVLHLPEGIRLKFVTDIISAARMVSPLLLKFKRDARVFFLSKLQNVEVLSHQLDTYIQTTQTICEKLEKSLPNDCGSKVRAEVEVDLEVDLSEEDVQRMLDHIKWLDFIRKDENFRMVFLFQEEESCLAFINDFSDREPRMLQFLQDLEATAVQLDSMNKGSKISSVAGSSVGAVGGVLSIVGLALLPVTAGVSVGLIVGGAALAVTSGVNSAVTTATEIGVNRNQQKKANEVFQSFMQDVEGIQGHMNVTGRRADCADVAADVFNVGRKICAVGKGIDTLADWAQVAAKEGKALRNVPRVAADVPDIGQAAVKGLALTKAARAGFIAVNALFLGMDVFFICKDSISLSKGSETEVSQLIRARAALWSSEIGAWQKIHDSLSEGLLTSEEQQAILHRVLYSERDI